LFDIGFGIFPLEQQALVALESTEPCGGSFAQWVCIIHKITKKNTNTYQIVESKFPHT
jgi:hypothetical protein